MAVRYSISDHPPQIVRLQGGVLYPHDIVEVPHPGADGEDEVPPAGVQYRFQLLKFVDVGQDISSYSRFAIDNADKIAAQLAVDVDLQAETRKKIGWEMEPPAADLGLVV